MTEQGIKFEEGVKPEMRDYTPRAFDQNAKTLVIDFAIHEAGAATDWARQAKVGDQLAIGGPRGSMIIPLAYSHYVLVGDETALPAIARRLEELPASAKATVLIEVASKASEIELLSQATVDVHWLHRDGAEAGTNALFENQLKNVELPNEDYFIWIAAETHVARYLRKLLIENYQIDKSYMKAAGYWQRGQSNVHSVIQDE